MIVRLEDANDLTKFGGKASNLAFLLQNRLKVPAGWAISHDGFNASGHLLKDVQLELDDSKLYAVRSSATVEDAGDKSWAGQFETFLYVAPKDVITKTEECHATSNRRTEAYAAEVGKGTDFKVAVVVQEMVNPEYAGVLFTKNPVSGKNEIVVEYVKGIGEQLVGGKVTPGQISWDRKSQKLITKKQAPFDTEDLISAGLSIEAFYDGVPQDIEWAIDKSGILWITQSRPITALNIKQTGEGHHYLGEPETLFYWGPASARPLYMSDFLIAEQVNFKHLYESKDYPNPPKTLLLFHENKSLWLNKADAFAEFSEEIFDAYVKHGDLQEDIADWKRAASKIEFDKVYEPKALSDLLAAAWRPTLIAELALYGGESSITKQLSNYSKDDQRRIIGGFSQPDRPTFINKIDEDVVDLNDPKKLAKKYWWSLSSYAGVGKQVSLEKYYVKRIIDLGGKADVIVGSAENRAHLARVFNLKPTIIKQLNLLRNIAEFMDDRKAWMMQSRSVIQKMVQTIAEKTGQEILHLENCRIDELTDESPQEYYGWTYLKGENISLKKAEVDRAWDWYVSYRAAESVLQGIVSSRGGLHFLSGEVVVVHDPIEQIPEGKIVVVPSTSPSYVPIMRRAAALITDHGGMMSHAAIVAREFNLPCIVGTVHATKVLKTGDKVVLDLVNGLVNKSKKEQKSGDVLSKFYEKQIPFTEWLEKVGHADTKAMRVENNYKRERLGLIAEIIPFPFDKPTTFDATELTSRTDELKKFIAENGEEACALRLIPKKGIHLEVLRNRGKKIKDVMLWYDTQTIDPTKYTVEFVPHMDVNEWSTIFIINDYGVFGEIIADGHNVLTQGFYDNDMPSIFTFDFTNWHIEPSNKPALKYLKEMISYVLVKDAKKQSTLKTAVDATFTHDYMKGYYETVYSKETGTWFIDYSRTLAKLYADFKLSISSPIAGQLQGRVASAPQEAVTGKVRIVDSPHGIELSSDEILVCKMTSPDYIPLIVQARAIITDQGGILCHAAIVARELKKPCIVGTHNATELLKTGDTVRLSLTNGSIEKQ